MTHIFFAYGGWAMLVLRVALGGLMIVHGWPKVKDLKQTATTFDGLGFKPGLLWGTIAGLLELFGGVALVLGVFTIFAAALFAIQFAVILVWKLSKHMPFVGGWELDLMIFAASIALLSIGAGVYSVDRWFF